MGIFDDAIEAADAVAFDIFAEDTQATHTDLSGSNTSVDIVLEPEQADIDYDDIGQQEIMTREASIRRTQLNSIEQRSTVVTDGYTYTVRRIISRDNLVIKVELKREANQRRHSETQYVRSD